MKEEGKLIIFSAPSGSGKTTIVKRLLEMYDVLEFSISATSRPVRKGETDAKDYYFIDQDTFSNYINEDRFAEWEEVYPGSYYGTLKSELERIWLKGHHVVFDVDVVGGCNLKEKFGERALSVFIQPPSLEVLKERLTNRLTESPESLQKRLSKAEQEMGYRSSFDVCIVNDELDRAVKETKVIVDDFLKAN